MQQGRDIRVENPIARRQFPNEVGPDPADVIVNVPRRGDLAFTSRRSFFKSVQTEDAAGVGVEWLITRQVH